MIRSAGRGGGRGKGRGREGVEGGGRDEVGRPRECREGV